MSLAPSPSDVPTLIAQTLFVAGLFIAYEFASSAVFGVTVGKRVLGLDVHDAQAQRVSLPGLLLRTLPWTLVFAFALLLFATTPASVLAMLPLAAAVVMLYRDDRRQTWYDRLAHTTVVKPR